MHAVENGWYWAGGQPELNRRRPGTNPPNVATLAEQLRISEDVAYWLVFFVSRHSPFRKLTDEEISKFPENVPGKLPYLLILPYGGRMRKVTSRVSSTRSATAGRLKLRKQLRF